MNNRTVIITSIAIVIALTLVISPLVMSADTVLATKHNHKHHHHHHHGDNGNSASQSISQSQRSSQHSQVVSGGDTVGSGNNISVQGQHNSGNNALAQQ